MKKITRKQLLENARALMEIIDPETINHPETLLIDLNSPPDTWEEHADIILPPDTPKFDPEDRPTVEAVCKWLEEKYALVGWYIDSDFHPGQTELLSTNGTGFYLMKDPDVEDRRTVE
jgi:hypothetical protein